MHGPAGGQAAYGGMERQVEVFEAKVKGNEAVAGRLAGFRSNLVGPLVSVCFCLIPGLEMCLDSKRPISQVPVT